MRKPLIVGNWKMNTTLSDAVVLTTQIRNAIEDLEADIVLCPPFVWLVPLNDLLEHAPDNLSLGAQNMWFADKGAITGEISPLMLKNLVKYVILGHSERRFHFGESNALINDKVHAALQHGITPILCISELKKIQNEKRGRGRPTFTKLRSDILQQLKMGLKGIGESDITKVIIVFEPVWAISTAPDTKGAASGVYAASVINRLKSYLEEKYGGECAADVTMLYGGSVDASNVAEFLYQPEIDGVLVGSASLKASEFIKICKIAGGPD